jgi:arginine decarboxylase
MHNQAQMPLLAALVNYAEAEALPFHTPGHKQGKGMAAPFTDVMGDSMLRYDLSLMSELDDLHQPQGCIAEAQQLAAELYGSDHSFFVVNGTTGGIQAMILAIVGPGDKIIVPRNSHRSIISGIIMSGARPIYIYPEIDDDLGLAMGVTPAAVAETLTNHPDAKGVLIINPTYYGVAADLKAIVDLVHKHNLPVIVDEAHGPHLKFSDKLPIQALDAGADICAQSTHKILGAMTQCSIVHCRTGRIDVARLKTMLQLVQSTSPNYILMASLDVARMQMGTAGQRLIGRSIELATYLRREINKIPGLFCFGAERIGRPGVYNIDPTKVTVTVTGLGLTGIAAEKILRSKYKIQAELCDMFNVLFLITLGDNQAVVDQLLAALQGLAVHYGSPKGLSDFSQTVTSCRAAMPSQPQQVMVPREALFGATIVVPFIKAAEHISAEIITFYPPGIPVLCPGERISQAMVDYCLTMQQAGMNISGPEDYRLGTIKVVA